MLRFATDASLLSERPGLAAVRLLVGSHILLLLQSLLILASPVGLGSVRPGVIAICALALLALACGLLGVGRPRREPAREPRHGA